MNNYLQAELESWAENDVQLNFIRLFSSSTISYGRVLYFFVFWALKCNCKTIENAIIEVENSLKYLLKDSHITQCNMYQTLDIYSTVDHFFT
jgi:hypothetical protein